jgi:hypothetical protein
LKKLYKGQPSFELYYPSKKALYDNALSLQLSAHSQQQLDEWKAAFLRIGVLYEHDKKDDSQEDGPEHSFDPSLETHLDNLRCLLENYIQIESKSVKVSVCVKCAVRPFTPLNSTIRTISQSSL